MRITTPHFETSLNRLLHIVPIGTLRAWGHHNMNFHDHSLSVAPIVIIIAPSVGQSLNLIYFPSRLTVTQGWFLFIPSNRCTEAELFNTSQLKLVEESGKYQSHGRPKTHRRFV
jgi:hypothetical protein